jgi:hypothetical protein
MKKLGNKNRWKGKKKDFNIVFAIRLSNHDKAGQLIDSVI